MLRGYDVRPGNGRKYTESGRAGGNRQEPLPGQQEVLFAGTMPETR